MDSWNRPVGPMTVGAPPDSLTVREGEIVVRCEVCGLRQDVRIGLHTFAEFWELMHSRGWRPADTPGHGRGAMLCPECAAAGKHDAPWDRSLDRGGGAGDE